MHGNTAIIFDIQHFCLHDGPGVRTTVFFKGCPLRCVWCHNPESISRQPDLLYRETQCVGCGACAAACTAGVHDFSDGSHRVWFDKCVKCGACEVVCCYHALELSGREMTLSDVLNEIEHDFPYYKNEGGVTLSGGEPMAQAQFALRLAKAVKEKGIHVCLETSGFASAESFQSIAPYVDLFLFDFKAAAEQSHQMLTGVDNRLICDNLKLLNDLAKDIVLRCPLVPGVNDTQEHFEAIASMTERFTRIGKVELLPYHKIGEPKYAQLGNSGERPIFTVPSSEAVQQWIRTLTALNCKNVTI